MPEPEIITKIIYMQSTINHMVKNHPGLVNRIEIDLGVPEVKEILDNEGEINKYYMISL